MSLDGKIRPDIVSSGGIISVVNIKQSIKELKEKLSGWQHDDIIDEVFGKGLI